MHPDTFFQSHWIPTIFPESSTKWEKYDLNRPVGEQVIPVTSAGFYYPVASGVPACFTGDTMVETPAGLKRMDLLKIGDLVLTAELNSTVFTPVTSFLHRLPDTVASFIRLQTDDGELKLTPQHFIYKVNCNDIDYNVDMIYAEDLKAGDCLYKTRFSALHKVVIRSVSTVRERGVYAPMTSSGDLLANDIYVSCHNVVKTSTLSQTFLDFAAHVQRKMRSLFGGAEDGHLPTTTEFFLNIIDHIIPTHSKMEL
ncbi:hint module [Teladorsagia circumcincta]|uniref:Hint module n=1 Tax=Teladorsagia circumcincta TaxID=45464 RepID=A0A2G9V3S6_TELCI|nr:hint module [Teladorsagia circumcincta]